MGMRVKKGEGSNMKGGGGRSQSERDTVENYKS